MPFECLYYFAASEIPDFQGAIPGAGNDLFPVWCDCDTIYVADQYNYRVQIFQYLGDESPEELEDRDPVPEAPPAP